jgi:hypothetical protein
MSTIRIPATNPLRCRKCRPVIWKHQDGWDVYPRSECYPAPDGSMIPAWFDSALVEDAPTRKAAIEELLEWHPIGICLA